MVTISFKQLANYYQCLFLILNERLDILTNIKEKMNDILIQSSNLIFDLNDYSEKKFGETNLGLKSENISAFSSDELMNKSNLNQLIEISEKVVNYVKIFLICLRFRKKIMKIFLAAIRDLNKNEIENNEEYDKNKKVLINQLDSLKAVSYYSQKNWRNILAKEKIGQIVRDISSIIPIINNYIEFTKNEHKVFSKNWLDYEEKIVERQKLSNDFLNELNNAKKNNQNINSKEYRDRYQKKLRKLKEIIKTSVDFIQKAVPTTREKDKNELLKLGTFFEKIFNNCQNINNGIITSVENDIDISVNTDIFEESEVIIIKYFNRFKIQNYENFLETIKIKLLINTNLNEEKLGKGVYNRLSNVNEEEKLSQINNINLGDSQYDSQLDFDNFRNRAQTIRGSKININKNPFGSKILKNDSIYLDK